MATQNGCPLLTKLPLELREAIYELAVTHDFVIWPEHRTKRAGDKSRIEPGLLATCWQIRQEATYLFYRSNTFRIPYLSSTKIFLRQLGSDRIRHLKALYLYGWFSRHSLENSYWRSTSVWVLADEFAHLGLRAKQINIYVRGDPWNPINIFEKFRTEMERLSIERGWGKGWTFEDAAVSKPKEA